MTNDPIKTGAKDLYEHFSRDVQIANKHANMPGISLVIWKLQTIARCPSHPPERLESKD